MGHRQLFLDEYLMPFHHQQQRRVFPPGRAAHFNWGKLPVEDTVSQCCPFVTRVRVTLAGMQKNVYFHCLKGVLFLLHASLQHIVQWIKAHVRFRRGQLEVKSNFCSNKDIFRLIMTHSGSCLWATGNNRGKLVSFHLRHAAGPLTGLNILLICTFHCLWMALPSGISMYTDSQRDPNRSGLMDEFNLHFQTISSLYLKAWKLTGSYSLQFHHRYQRPHHW